jgi:murein DD-endopeptidase MepM/ murein hydrolase activator NlpD
VGYGLGVITLFVVIILALTPVGLRGFFGSFTVEAARRENHARQNQALDLAEQLIEVAARVGATLERGRRIAWVVGAPQDVWMPSVSAPPPERDGLTAWLLEASRRLDVLGEALQLSAVQPPTELLSLPLQRPVGPARGVPVSLFGWQASPFTGKSVANRGVTWVCERGEAVLAPGGGTVAYAGSPQGKQVAEWMRLETIVVLDHGGGVRSVLGHLQQTAVRRGDVVSRGQRVGSAGISAWTKVPTVYLEIRWPFGEASRPVDPSLLIADLPVADHDRLLADPCGGLGDDFPAIEPLLTRRTPARLPVRRVR